MAKMVALGDHAPIAQHDLAQWLTHAQANDCALVLTEKDGARLNPSWPEAQACYLLRAQLEPHNTQQNKEFLSILGKITGG